MVREHRGTRDNPDEIVAMTNLLHVNFRGSIEVFLDTIWMTWDESEQRQRCSRDVPEVAAHHES